MVNNTDYYKDLPSDDYIREGLSYVHDLWRERNRFIDEVRRVVEGRNTIEAPKQTPYKIRTVHSYSLASIINEKAARFTQLPTIQVVPEDESLESRSKSSDIELAINIALQEMERRSDGDVWSRAILDAILLDEGVERIERAPAAFWPEIITINDSGDITMPFEDNDINRQLTTAAKKRYGLPIRSIFVPLENFFPIYEGPTLIESYEVELRTLRDVLRNPLFGNKDQLQFYSKDESTSLRTQVSIIHYVNAIWHAYFAMTPGTTTNIGSSILWPDYTSTDLAVAGTPLFLYGYKHNLGISLYNTISGRFGGWKTSHNRIEGVAKGLLELNVATDEVLSQVYTNIRAKYWPTMLQQIDPELRGIETGTPPLPITVPEGQNLAIYKGESVEPLFQPVDDPIVPWVYDKLQEQMARLGGSPVIFGQRTPGVETGYHQALQITQAEHLDEKLEQHFSVAAANRARIMLQHIKVMDLGEVYTHHTEINTQGKRSGKYYTIDPNDLSPMPRMDAQVRRPRPVDFSANIRAAREASDERQGKGPIMSDDSIRADLLSMPAPDIEKHKIDVERAMRRIWDSGVLDAKILEALNIKLATQGVPTEFSGPVAPAASEAAQQLTNGAQPQNVQSPTNGNVPPSTTPLNTGQPVGQSQPEANAGREIAGALYG